MHFNNAPLPVEQNNYATKTVNAYIAFDLDNWPEILLANFAWENCLFDPTNRAKMVIKVSG